MSIQMLTLWEEGIQLPIQSHSSSPLRVWGSQTLRLFLWVRDNQKSLPDHTQTETAWTRTIKF
jgi:hypothetical protein